MALPINIEDFDEYIRQGEPWKKVRAEGIRLLVGTCPKKYRG